MHRRQQLDTDHGDSGSTGFFSSIFGASKATPTRCISLKDPEDLAFQGVEEGNVYSSSSAAAASKMRSVEEMGVPHEIPVEASAPPAPVGGDNYGGAGAYSGGGGAYDGAYGGGAYGDDSGTFSW